MVAMMKRRGSHGRPGGASGASSARGAPGASVICVMIALSTAAPLAGCASRSLFDTDSLFNSPAAGENWTPPAPIAADAGPKIDSPTPPMAPPRGGADLPLLVDYALKHNPSTRLEWEKARAAAAQVGVVNSAYFPTLNAVGFGGAVESSSAGSLGREVTHGPILSGGLELNWVLLDFGRRDAASEGAARALAAADYDYNRTIQTVVFKVQRAYFDLDAKLALEKTAAQNLETANTQKDAVDDRLRAGLATMPDSLQAKQRLAKARFDLESARAESVNSRATLARELGLSAETPISILSLQDLPLPEGLEGGIDRMIELTVVTRPDIRAGIARVREAESRVKEAEAAFMPIVRLSGGVGGALYDYRVSTQPGPPFPPIRNRYNASLPEYAIGLRGSWLLFDGFERESAVLKAQAEKRAAVASLEKLRLDASNEVWAAYFDFRAARLQYDFGESLLRASQDAYDSVLQSYTQGLRTVTDLLQAESDLFAARSTLVRTRADLLSSSVRLSYALGANAPQAAPGAPTAAPAGS